MRLTACVIAYWRVAMLWVEKLKENSSLTRRIFEITTREIVIEAKNKIIVFGILEQKDQFELKLLKM